MKAKFQQKWVWLLSVKSESSVFDCFADICNGMRKRARRSLLSNYIFIKCQWRTHFVSDFGFARVTDTTLVQSGWYYICEPKWHILKCLRNFRCILSILPIATFNYFTVTRPSFAVCCTATLWEGWVLLYLHGNRRLIKDGSSGRSPRLSHNSWALHCNFWKFSCLQL